jgi:hypothetical protein|tara:strand:- start:1166 stop:1357 length:192 start_codon:yes stop_codon:yes gene_type:complete
MYELLRLSITDNCDDGTIIIANTILNKDMFFAEFSTMDDALRFLDFGFTKIGDGVDFSYYIRK